MILYTLDFAYSSMIGALQLTRGGVSAIRYACSRLSIHSRDKHVSSKLQLLIVYGCGGDQS